MKYYLNPYTKDDLETGRRGCFKNRRIAFRVAQVKEKREAFRREEI